MQQPNDTSALDYETRRTALAYARRVIEAASRGDANPPTPPEAREDVAHEGCFVSLHGPSGLRGCIGTFGADAPLFDTIAHVARQSALNDPRFGPVQPDEVPMLDIEISVLTPRTSAAPGEIKVGRHGVSLRLGHANSVFLPQVAPQQRWNRDRLLSELCRKAGLSRDSWRHPEAELSVFEAVVFSERSGV